MYRTSDIARKTNIHTNTVRFYERLELISPVPRDTNEYRVFDDRHLVQVMILRCIFLDEWPGRSIRKASMNIINAMKAWDLDSARQYTHDYKDIIEEEAEKARQAIRILKQWSETANLTEAEKTYNKREAAFHLGVTPEALRNWERNDLIHIPRQGQHNSRVYGHREMERLKVIYLLRQARFSLSAIHGCLIKLDAGNAEEALQTLQYPDEQKTSWTGDRWLAVLERTATEADHILQILDKAENSNPTLIHHPPI